MRNIVYSTNKSLNLEGSEEEIITPPPARQDLRVLISKKGRGGKTATLVTGFIGNLDSLEKLGKELKVYCGVGGSVKDGEIILQGDKREKVLNYLINKGYKAKKSGG